MTDWIRVCDASPRHRTLDSGLLEREGTGVVRAPKLVARVQKVIASYGDLIAEACARHRFPAHWLVALIAFESGGDPGVVSPGVGARGLVQMMPATARALGRDPDQLWDPAYAIESSLLYLDQSAARYGLDWPTLAGAYNAGSKRCAAQTACKTKGVKDGTFADNSWGLIEDCQQGVSSRYIEVLVGAANEALLLGYSGGAAYLPEATTGAIWSLFAALGLGTMAAALTYAVVR